MANSSKNLVEKLCIFAKPDVHRIEVPRTHPKTPFGWEQRNLLYGVVLI